MSGLYPSISHLYCVICITPGTAGVVYGEEKEKQVPWFVENATFKSNEMACSACSGYRRNVWFIAVYLHTYLNIHWLFQLALSVHGGDFSGIKFGLCYGFSAQWRPFFFILPSGCFETFPLQRFFLHSLYKVHIYFLLHLFLYFSVFFILLTCVTALLICSLMHMSTDFKLCKYLTLALIDNRKSRIFFFLAIISHWCLSIVVVSCCPSRSF